MKYNTLLIFFFSLQTVTWAEMARPEVEASAPPALTIDSWTPKEPLRTVVLIPKPLSSASPILAPAATAALPESHPVVIQKISTAIPAPRSPMNEMKGTIASIDTDGRVIRLSVDGGYNPQLSYDAQTLVEASGSKLTLKDLETGDNVIIRYVGKDLTAREIERFPKPTHSSKAHAAVHNTPG